MTYTIRWRGLAGTWTRVHFVDKYVRVTVCWRAIPEGAEKQVGGNIPHEARRCEECERRRGR